MSQQQPTRLDAAADTGQPLPPAASDTASAQEGAAIERPLCELVTMIKEEIELGQTVGLKHYRKAGEMLIRAKTQVDRGEWTWWVRQNFALSVDTAQSYMKLARTKPSALRFVTTLSAVARPNRKPRQVPVWQEPLRLAVNEVDIERLAQERQSREREARHTRELALRLIDIGYKALAGKLHPDKGGSAEAMTRLNGVRAFLKRHAVSP